MTAVKYTDGAVQVCQERIIICVCVQEGLSQLFRTLLVEKNKIKKSLTLLGQGFRAALCYQGAGLEAKVLALFVQLCFLYKY